jgi:hypothetical protein
MDVARKGQGMGRGGRRPGAGRKPNRLKRLVIRAGDLARLSREEIQFLEAIARKLAAFSPDAHRNQTESKPAIETVSVAPNSVSSP